MHETVRLQLFEVREGEQVGLIGEFKSTHQELQEHFADGIQQVNPALHGCLALFKACKRIVRSVLKSTFGITFRNSKAICLTQESVDSASIYIRPTKTSLQTGRSS